MFGLDAEIFDMVAQNRVSLPCATCGVLVIRRASELLKSSSRGNVFCSREHYHSFNAGTKRTRRRNNMTCDECGISFPRCPGAVRGEHVYCSIRCSAIARGGHDNTTLPVGSMRVTGDGYVALKVAAGDWQPQHRVVMAGSLGRPLRTFENVHHRNGDRADNRPENLELWVKSQPAGQRPIDLVTWAHELLDLYEAEVSVFA